MRSKNKTPKEEFIESTINLTLSGLEAKQLWEKSLKAADDNIFTKTNIYIASAIVKAKDVIDKLLGDRKNDIHDIIAKLLS